MNCKPGDMAFYVRSAAGNEGRIVQVIESLGVDWRGQMWLVESQGSPLNTNLGNQLMQAPARDSYLHPIRPGDMEDKSPTVRELEQA